MKIYTKAGDDGKTSLFGGKRIPKYADRIESYGTVDELNSFVGMLNDSISIKPLKEELLRIQHNLFDIGSVLATDPEGDFKLPGVSEEDVSRLEQSIDAMQEKLPALKNFILPGGHQSISLAHVCRTVTRRAERRVLAVAHTEDVDKQIVLFLNRLSDYFFVVGRYIALEINVEEIKWEAKK